jgi:hypothetical protein
MKLWRTWGFHGDPGRRGFLVGAFLIYDADGTPMGHSREAWQSMVYERMIGGPNYACGIYVFGLDRDMESWLLNEVDTGCG